MKYAFLIHRDREAGLRPGDGRYEDVVAKFAALNAETEAKGTVSSAARLDDPALARTVRVRKGEQLVTDGPFVETREQLCGLYVLECPDLDAALDFAARIPMAEYGSVEVRPVLEM